VAGFCVDKAILIKKTGFEDKKIRNITYRLRKQGKIKRALKGLYEWGTRHK